MSVKLLLPLLIAICLTGCGERHEKKAEREQAAHDEMELTAKAERSRLVAELRAPYQADEQWANEPVAWTIDLQERLIRPDGRPIVGIARLRDVEKRGNSRMLYLIPDPYEQPRIEFLLTCENPLRQAKGGAGLEWLLGDHLASLAYPEYVFVARIVRVARRDITFDREGAIDTRPQWRAEGECLALREIIQREGTSEPPKKTYGR